MRAIDWSQAHYCTGCERRLFPKGDDAADWPDGSARHKSRGQCESCYKNGGVMTDALRRAIEGRSREEHELYPHISPERHQRNVDALASYMERRNARLSGRIAA